MSENKIDPEVLIVEAACKVFIRHGVDKSTMLQVADEAGIGRTSLHYYFRSKANLYKRVLQSIEDKIFPTISKIVDNDLPVLGKIVMFINEYNDLIIKNPLIPGFLAIEMQRNPDWILNLIKSRGLDFEKVMVQVDQEISEGKIRPFSFVDLFANVVGMSVLPLLSKPIYMEFFFDQDTDEFNKFMVNRKKTIISVIERWLEPN